jgi:hypothetical protein
LPQTPGGRLLSRKRLRPQAISSHNPVLPIYAPPLLQILVIPANSQEKARVKRATEMIRPLTISH